MIFERIKTPGIAHVAYLIGNKGQAAIVDPRRDVADYVKLARKNNLPLGDQALLLPAHGSGSGSVGCNLAERARKLVWRRSTGTDAR